MLKGSKKDKEDKSKQDIGSFNSVLTPPKPKSKVKKLKFFKERQDSEMSRTDLSDIESQTEKVGAYKDTVQTVAQKTSNLKNVAYKLDLIDDDGVKRPGKLETKKSSSKSVTFREAEIFIIASSKNSRVKDRISFDIAILFIGHLLKYADKFAITGVRNELERYFNIGRRELLTFRTICLISLVVASPVFGYFGDRLKRKQVVSIGIFACSIMTYSSSFVPANMFGLFIFCQMLVSIGEASFCIMVLSMIADLFQGSMRSLAFTLYCMAIPLGSGFGYTFAKKVTSLTKNWKWSFRISPVVGVACSAFIWFSMDEPRKGASDGRFFFRNTSLLEDLKYIFKHRTFIFLTLGASCVSFVFGAMAVWGPLHIYNSAKAFDSSITLERVTMTFELITCISGVGGVLFGYIVCSFIRKYFSDADSIVCGSGMVLNGILIFLALGLKRQSLGVTWICIFYSQLFIYTNVAIVSDILMYTIVPTRRSLATSLQMFISHMLGDVGSPYIISAVPFSVYVNCFVSILGGIFFFTTSAFRGSDRRTADEWIRRGSRRRSSMLQDIQQLSMMTMDSGSSRNPSTANPDLISSIGGRI